MNLQTMKKVKLQAADWTAEEQRRLRNLIGTNIITNTITNTNTNTNANTPKTTNT